MKRFFVPAVSALTIALLGACVDEPPKKPRGKPHSPPNTSTTSVDPNAQPDPTAPPPTEGTKPPTDTTHPPSPVPESTQPPVARGEIPYAKPVPGKPGFVFSPYDQFKGYIDVRGFPPGTEVKDPYSQKSFLVP